MITIYNRNNASLTKEINPKDGYTPEWTTFVPPAQVEGKTLRFMGDKWVYIDNEQIRQNELLRFKNELIQRVQTHLDNKAKELSYENIFTMCSYKDSSVVQWKEEADKAILWRDAVWLKCYELLNNDTEITSFEELLEHLPEY